MKGNWQTPALVLMVSAMLTLLSWLFVSWIGSEKESTRAAFGRVQEYIGISRNALIKNLEGDAETRAGVTYLKERVDRIESNLDAEVAALEAKRVIAIQQLHERISSLVRGAGSNGSR